jgi:hypothetical protein
VLLLARNMLNGPTEMVHLFRKRLDHTGLAVIAFAEFSIWLNEDLPCPGSKSAALTRPMRCVRLGQDKPKCQPWGRYMGKGHSTPGLALVKRR